MQEGGRTQAIGPLEIGNRDPVGLAQAEERVAGLNVINDPTVRRATGQRSLGAHGRDIKDHAGNQSGR